MGSEIRSLAGDFHFSVTGGVASSTENRPSGVVSSVGQLTAENVDLVIDFSLPHLTVDVVGWCLNHKKPLVSGVTGITEEQRALLASAGAQIPVLWAPNMSLGVAVMARMLSAFSLLEGFEFQLEELHHKHKKDRPSGTALFLQERLHEAVGKVLPDPVAIRGGGIFGIHRIWAMGEEETITLEHTAMNRRVFARGALKAADWLLSKSPGLYRMDDVLGT